ncbi:flagellar biosynthesis anti-sigma factor FlgM [Pseudodesulfovibrio sp. F-1]|uniref:Negative regulator of flagellin synthesis n=1 Tax=Pseudodesulfovibrio alkaliphilus TaxID=2661613 RepID=A0A7K1KJ11_9BACT|nr:flagellar biosynthesis anti-sigma factor FlgM [Pseudodesulfovibrio alkaliphilus]MUM76044.1 flagellar biosynthesis anti-sigma factor FlgM [Pseudodesulfovibrio alkaliphilus]
MVIKNIAGEMTPYSNRKIENQRTADQQRRGQESARTAGESADKVVLSSEARLRGAALQAANEASDVRRRKIDDLKQQIKDGTYKPDLKKAAANLIRDDLDLLSTGQPE